MASFGRLKVLQYRRLKYGMSGLQVLNWTFTHDKVNSVNR